MNINNITVSNIVNIMAYRLSLYFLKLRLLFQRKFGRKFDYQSDPFVKKAYSSPNTRLTYDRFSAIKKELPNSPISVIDIGCNDGFFVFKFAEQGGFCLGLDQDRNTVMIAQARAAINKLNNALFSNISINENNINSLPKVDVIVFLSVFHHWVRHLGLSKANELLEKLAMKADKKLIFETGQSDEKEARWVDSLAFMGDDPDSWIQEKLKSLGFSEIKNVGKFSTTVGTTPRNLYVASR